ncbi:MAG: squalene/phytoene synthase family protein, partial [Bacteroidales bacterium]|nr:squalene/phytoene synthase family protein [Bacteroidales bacterium]
MVVDELFLKCAYKASEIVTKQYSTSFSLSTFFLPKEQRKSIYAIYGFVRLADEIVDTFNNFDKHTLFNQFINEFYYSLEHGISSNILLVSFVDTVRKYKIPVEYINAFLESMQKDLSKKDYESTKETDDYIYGSANVVGLMC